MTEIAELLAAFASVCTWTTVYYYRWRMSLVDEADHELLELAVASGAETIVIKNVCQLESGELRFLVSGSFEPKARQGELTMATVSVGLPDEKHARLKLMAKRYRISLSKLFEELSMTKLAELDVETRLRVRAERGSVERGLAILDGLDALARQSSRTGG